MGGSATAGIGGVFWETHQKCSVASLLLSQARENSQGTLNYSISGGEGCTKWERLQEPREESREQQEKGMGQTHSFPDRILPCSHGL